jgi:hypothetical protein
MGLENTDELAMRLLEEKVDELPSFFVNNTNRYKCENGWFQGVYGVAGNAQTEERLSPITFEYFKAMAKYFKKTHFHGRLTARKDIKMGNSFLVMVLRDYGVEKYLKGEDDGGRDDD